MDKLLTIGIPAFNMEKYLSNCVESILRSKYIEDLDIIIVNDGSIDKTLTIAQDFELKHPASVRVVDKENGGHGSGINRSLDLAQGKYFKILDADDWVDTEELDKVVKELKNCNEDILIMPFVSVNEVTGEHTRFDCTELQGTFGSIVENIDNVSSIYKMHALCFRTDVLRKNTRRITEKCFYVDQEYILYPIGFIKTYRYMDATVYQYRLGRSDQSVNWNSMIKNRNMHEKVIMDLHDDFSSKELSIEEKTLYSQRISDLLVKQLSIFKHMEFNASTYKEYYGFIKAIKNFSADEKKRKIVRLLCRFPFMFLCVLLIKREEF